MRRTPRHFLRLLCLCATLVTACPLWAAPDIIFEDFEKPLQGWTITGDAFGPDGTTAGTLPNQSPVIGFFGQRLANSYHGLDKGQGVLTSPTFTITRRFIQLLVGGGYGGYTPGKCEVRLVVNDAPCRQATGMESEWLRLVRWDVSAWTGQQAHIEIVDHTEGGWGYILVDHIVFSDGPDGEIRPPMLVTDCEKPLAQWTTTGTAFADNPMLATSIPEPAELVCPGYSGKRLLCSRPAGDGAQGTLTSPPFTIPRRYLRFAIGGGRMPGKCELRLWIGKQYVAATGCGTIRLNTCCWDLNQYQGQQAKFEIVDLSSDGWGFITLDDLIFTDDPFDPAISIEPSALAPATAGAAYFQGLTQNRGAEPVAYQLTAGKLPEGLTLGQDGAITGTPAGAEMQTFTVKVTDADGMTATAVRRLAVQPALLANPPPPGADWPQWRGPSRTGVDPVSPPLASAWPASGPKKLWEVHPISVAPGPYAGGHSCPVIAEGRVYQFIHDKTRKQEMVICLDAQTGATSWVQRFPSRDVMHGASSTPCVVDGRLFVNGARMTYCLDAKTGNLIWKQDTGVPAKDSAVRMPNQEVSSSFLLVKGIAATMLGPCFGFEAATGKVLWNAPESGGYSGTMTTPTLWLYEGKPYLVYCGFSRMCCVDALTGAVLWDAPGNGMGFDYTPTPALRDDILAVCWHGKLGAYRLTTNGPQLLWEAPYFDPYSSPVLDGGRVFAAGRQLAAGQPACICYDLETGKHLWERVIPDPEYSSPLLADGKLILLGNKGKRLTMLNAQNGKPLASIAVNGKLWASPVIANGRLYLRLTDDGVVCFDLTAQANGIPTAGIARPIPVASYCCWSDSVEALCDGKELACSTDGSIPRMTWWDHKGTAEWVGYDFIIPRTLTSVAVYWMDDGGGLALPQSWQLIYWSSDGWKPVQALDPYGVDKDRYNIVRFTPIATTALRLLVQLKPDKSAGIGEWKIGDAK